jgi:hypothetical protein
VLHQCADSLIARGIPYLDINRHEAELCTGEDSLILVCRDVDPVRWRTTEYREHFLTLTPLGPDPCSSFRRILAVRLLIFVSSLLLPQVVRRLVI